ncbi:MAG: biotin/lipoyl-containing protein [Rikenellaceae bacterium]
MKEYKFKINGNDYAVSVNDIVGSTASVAVNGTTYDVEVEGLETKSAPKIVQVAASPAAQSVTPAPAARPVAGGAGGAAVKSPLPGVVVSVAVNVGDTVAVGQRLLVLEAMKMENNIDADRAGVVKSIVAGKGTSVLEGDVLLTIE